MKQTGVTLKYMMQFESRCKQKNLLISAHFLHKQLPIRLARSVMELERLPFGSSQKHPVLKSEGLVFRFVSGPEILRINKNHDGRDSIYRKIKAIKEEAQQCGPHVALGVHQFKKELYPKFSSSEFEEINQFLDRFLSFTHWHPYASVQFSGFLLVQFGHRMG